MANLDNGYLDLMIDLETLGTIPGCGILTIGVVSTDLAHRFYEKVKPTSNKSFRLFTQPSTQEWWDKQAPEIREESFSGYLELHVVLQTLQQWVKDLPLAGREIRIWGNGGDFDMPILRVAFHETRVADPFPPFSARCYRTMKERFPEVKKPNLVEGKHIAVVDALNQAAHLRLILDKEEELKRK